MKKRKQARSQCEANRGTRHSWNVLSRFSSNEPQQQLKGKCIPRKYYTTILDPACYSASGFFQVKQK